MPAVRTVAASARLPHQIRITVPHGGHAVQVTCVCRIRRGLPPFGDLGPDGSVWPIYHGGEHDSPLIELISGERRDYRVA
jgi:hypothetical protein